MQMLQGCRRIYPCPPLLLFRWILSWIRLFGMVDSSVREDKFQLKLTQGHFSIVKGVGAEFTMLSSGRPTIASKDQSYSSRTKLLVLPHIGHQLHYQRSHIHVRNSSQIVGT